MDLIKPYFMPKLKITRKFEPALIRLRKAKTGEEHMKAVAGLLNVCSSWSYYPGKDVEVVAELRALLELCAQYSYAKLNNASKGDLLHQILEIQKVLNSLLDLRNLCDVCLKLGYCKDLKLQEEGKLLYDRPVCGLVPPF